MRTLLNVHHPRAFVATALANAIYAAHETNELSWSVNVHNEQIKLNVGQFAVLHVRSSAFGFMLAASELHGLDLQSVPGYDYYGECPWISGTLWGFLDQDHVSSYQLLQHAHLELIRQASRKQRMVRSQSRNTHAPGLLEYLRRHGHAVPNPGYASAVRAS
jgi:hypothetical protein